MSGVARRIHVSGVVQGVGFRPFVARLAGRHGLGGWVRNGHHGVEIHVEGEGDGIHAFTTALRAEAPSAARIDGVDVAEARPGRVGEFRIVPSDARESPVTVPISPDLTVCAECLHELADPRARRFGYPYINCTNCGPRFSIVLGLPYDRQRTTMAAWEMCSACLSEYADVGDRRFHAEPIACPRCGPGYRLLRDGNVIEGSEQAIRTAAALLRDGAIVALKGIGGYHLTCDASNAQAVAALRERKFRKSQPFAVMVKDVAAARALARIGRREERLLTSPARPIVVAPAREILPGVAPGHGDIGVMLPYAPVHHLLFDAGAPDVLVVTSGNRSTEPIAFEDADACSRLGGIADASLVGERAIARRVDDSVVRMHGGTSVVVRRARGYAPGVVARLPAAEAILAVGSDLKNSVTLVVDGNALVSQHLGDLEHVAAADAFRTAVDDLMATYGLEWRDVIVAHDAHPQYVSTDFARRLPARRHVAVQHHRAHVASVLAEHGELQTRVLGVAFDGTGYGDDATIWGGEFLLGSIGSGFERVASLRPFPLPGGDAAARHPVQAAAGCLYEVEQLPDLSAAPFSFPGRYARARSLVTARVRTFTSTSAGRLFDTAAALLGFTSAIEYEGQAAAWLEQLARTGRRFDPLPIAVTATQLDFRPTLAALAQRRANGDAPATLALAFHDALATGIVRMGEALCERHGVDTVVLSGGTFQNALLAVAVRRGLRARRRRVLINAIVPPNDGGISLGQAACAALSDG